MTTKQMTWPAFGAIGRLAPKVEKVEEVKEEVPPMDTPMDTPVDTPVDKPVIAKKKK